MEAVEDFPILKRGPTAITAAATAAHTLFDAWKAMLPPAAIEVLRPNFWHDNIGEWVEVGYKR